MVDIIVDVILAVTSSFLILKSVHELASSQLGPLKS